MGLYGDSGGFMASFDQDELEDSFEIEFSQMPGAPVHPVLRFWHARQPDTVSPPSEQRRRYSSVAILMALVCLVLFNILDLSALISTGSSRTTPSRSADILQGHAAGYSWFDLRQRPLHLPTLAHGASCPVTPVSQQAIQFRTTRGIGNSTIFAAPQNMDANGVQHAEHGEFARLAATYGGVLVTWYVRLPREEPVLIRGAQLDGPGVLLFDGGSEQPQFNDDILAGRTLSRLLISSAPDHGSPVAQWLSVTRIRTSGCYAYQVDMPTQSMVLVFKAVVEP